MPKIGEQLIPAQVRLEAAMALTTLIERANSTIQIDTPNIDIASATAKTVEALNKAQEFLKQLVATYPRALSIATLIGAGVGVYMNEKFINDKLEFSLLIAIVCSFLILGTTYLDDPEDGVIEVEEIYSNHSSVHKAAETVTHDRTADPLSTR
jgi:hypothetical protein